MCGWIDFIPTLLHTDPKLCLYFGQQLHVVNLFLMSGLLLALMLLKYIYIYVVQCEKLVKGCCSDLCTGCLELMAVLCSIQQKNRKLILAVDSE